MYVDYPIDFHIEDCIHLHGEEYAVVVMWFTDDKLEKKFTELLEADTEIDEDEHIVFDYLEGKATRYGYIDFDTIYFHWEYPDGTKTGTDYYVDHEAVDRYLKEINLSYKTIEDAWDKNRSYYEW